MARNYDPVKAHEYYIRTRQLKGRKSGQQLQTATDRVGSANSKLVKRRGNQFVVTSKHEQLQKAADQRVAALKKRLDRLHEVLEKLVEQAKERSGVETKAPTNGTATKTKSSSSKTSSSSSKSSTTKTHKTAQEKEKARQESKEYYEKHKKTVSPEKQAQRIQSQIKDVQEQIRQIRAQLKGSVNEARHQLKLKQTTASGR